MYRTNSLQVTDGKEKTNNKWLCDHAGVTNQSGSFENFRACLATSVLLRFFSLPQTGVMICTYTCFNLRSSQSAVRDIPKGESNEVSYPRVRVKRHVARNRGVSTDVKSKTLGQLA